MKSPAVSTQQRLEPPDVERGKNPFARKVNFKQIKSIASHLSTNGSGKQFEDMCYFWSLLKVIDHLYQSGTINQTHMDPSLLQCLNKQNTKEKRFEACHYVITEFAKAYNKIEKSEKLDMNFGYAQWAIQALIYSDLLKVKFDKVKINDIENFEKVPDDTVVVLAGDLRDKDVASDLSKLMEQQLEIQDTAASEGDVASVASEGDVASVASEEIKIQPSNYIPLTDFVNKIENNKRIQAGVVQLEPGIPTEYYGRKWTKLICLNDSHIRDDILEAQNIDEKIQVHNCEVSKNAAECVELEEKVINKNIQKNSIIKVGTEFYIADIPSYIDWKHAVSFVRVGDTFTWYDTSNNKEHKDYNNIPQAMTYATIHDKEVQINSPEHGATCYDYVFFVTPLPKPS
jgi:hypothetical protein